MVNLAIHFVCMEFGIDIHRALNKAECLTYRKAGKEKDWEIRAKKV